MGCDIHFDVEKKTAPDSSAELLKAAADYERALEMAPTVLTPGLAAAARYFLCAQEGNLAIVADPYVGGRKVNLLRGTVEGAAAANALIEEILDAAEKGEA